MQKQNFKVTCEDPHRRAGTVQVKFQASGLADAWNQVRAKKIPDLLQGMKVVSVEFDTISMKP